MTTSTEQAPTLVDCTISTPYSVDVANINGDSNYWAKSSSLYSIKDSLTNTTDDLVNN